MPRSIPSIPFTAQLVKKTTLILQMHYPLQAYIIIIN